MGNYDTFHDTGLAKCNFVGLDVHLSTKKTQSWGKREGWE